MTSSPSLNSRHKFVISICAFILMGYMSISLVTSYLDQVAQERHLRLKPRYEIETEIRGKTYHVHTRRARDIKVRENYQRRITNSEIFKPHFIARRDTVEDTGSGNRFYKLSGGSVEDLKLKCSVCSIVGSAGTLTSSNAGSKVDESHCVFRLGLAPVDGFETDVGTKTTVRIVDGKSFSNLLKRPQKLIAGPLASAIWILFDHAEVIDATKLQFKLRPLQKTNVQVYTVTRRAENQAMVDFKNSAEKIGYKLENSEPSTLWYTVQAALSTNCQKINVFGVPPPKFCKEFGTISKSRYWDSRSPPFCSLGKDSGSIASTAESQLISVSDRRALLGLTQFNQSETSFKFSNPTWILDNKTS